MSKLVLSEVRRSTRLAAQVATREVSRTATQAMISGYDGRPRNKRAKVEVEEPDFGSAPGSVVTKRAKKDLKAKLSLNPEDYPARPSNLWKIGAHVSAAGGIENTVLNAASVGANAFALFVKSQRKWESAPLSHDSILAFKSRLEAFGYSPSHILPHGSYLINLGNPDREKREKSYQCFLDDLKRCEQLGIPLYNFHPGSTVGAASAETSISFIAELLNRAHKATQFVVIVLENMAGSGNVVGASFEDLAAIIRQVENKQRVGVCLDTCHLFAAGYDIRTSGGWNATMADFESKVGLSFLKGMHLNDSKTGLNSRKDRHENIGLGHLGLSTFQHVISDVRMQNMPLILETPSFEAKEVWEKEIDVLNRISEVDRGGNAENLITEILGVVARHNPGSSKVGTAGKKRRHRPDESDRDIT